MFERFCMIHGEISRASPTLHQFIYILRTSRPALSTGSEGMGQYKLCDLPAESCSDDVAVAKVDPGINSRVDDFLDGFVKRVPLPGDARECDDDRRVKLLPENRFQHESNRAAVGRM